MQYCTDCGEKLVNKNDSTRCRLWCPSCSGFKYRQLKVGAGALIEKARGLLLVQRKNAPFTGSWNLPAGYVEADENPQAAVVREVFEETGLRVQVLSLEDVYYFNDDPRGSGIMLCYRCNIVGGGLQESSETSNAAYFLPAAIPGDLAGGGHDQAVEAWRSRQ